MPIKLVLTLPLIFGNSINRNYGVILSDSLHYPKAWLTAKKRGHKISILTAYDANQAYLLSQTKIDALLVGDSLGMVLQGHHSTLPVTLSDMLYHCRIVRRGAPNTFIIGDMPFGSYQKSSKQAISNGMRLMQEGCVNAIKFEGCQKDLLRAIEKLTATGVPVVGHLGMMPQSYHTLGGYTRQGKDAKSAEHIQAQAQQLQDAGCFALVLELVEPKIAQKISKSMELVTIGIGSGIDTDAQVQVLHDLLGLNPDFQPQHAAVYAQIGKTIQKAAQNYCQDVRDEKFKAPRRPPEDAPPTF